MRQRKKFATIELDEIKHLIAQSEDGEADGSGATVAPKPPASAQPKLKTTAQRSRSTAASPRANGKDDVTRRI